MASILDIMNTTVGEKFISKASEKTSESKENVVGVLGMAMPLLLGSIKNNLSAGVGTETFDNALQNEKHGEHFLNDLENIAPSEMINEGQKITTHILGEKENNIVQVISNTLQIKESSVADILKMAAPLLMSVLASQKRKDNIDASGLGDLITSVLGKSSKFDSSLVDTILSQDADNIIKNAKNMILGGGTKGKKDGGILGGMLGGK